MNALVLARAAGGLFLIVWQLGRRHWGKSGGDEGQEVDKEEIMEVL